MGIALLMTLGLLLGVAALSLLSGTLSFLFSRPRIQILRSEQGENGFAFSFSPDTTAYDDRFDQIRVRLFNPFGNPDQVDLLGKFSPGQGPFARDVNLGPGYRQLLDAKDSHKATVQIEISQRKGSVTFDKQIPIKKFFQEHTKARLTVQQFEQQNNSAQTKKYYHTPKRDFIVPPIPQKNKSLKLATNPEFAADFMGAETPSKESNENFAVSKVWIDPGCIVCDACEAIYPEVFEVKEDTCVIRPNAPLHDGLRIEEAAEACPVEVIKFTKAAA